MSRKWKILGGISIGVIALGLIGWVVHSLVIIALALLSFSALIVTSCVLAGGEHVEISKKTRIILFIAGVLVVVIMCKGLGWVASKSMLLSLVLFFIGLLVSFLLFGLAVGLGRFIGSGGGKYGGRRYKYKRRVSDVYSAIERLKYKIAILNADRQVAEDWEERRRLDRRILALEEELQRLEEEEDEL